VLADSADDAREDLRRDSPVTNTSGKSKTLIAVHFGRPW
jgi:hypothetical protein